MRVSNISAENSQFTRLLNDKTSYITDADRIFDTQDIDSDDSEKTSLMYKNINERKFFCYKQLENCQLDYLAWTYGNH